MSSKPVGNVNATEFQLRWSINFRSEELTSKTNGEHVSSATFITHSFGREIKWLLKLYPKGIKKDDEDVISIFLINKSGFEVKATVSFFLLDLDRRLFKYKDVKAHDVSTAVQSWGLANFVEQSVVTDTKNNLLNNGEMTIGCGISIDSVSVQDEESFSRLQEFDDFETIFLAERYSDLTVYTSDHESIRVHKSILAGRSGRMEGMFNLCFGQEQNSITIKVEKNVLLEVFRFIYCGKVNNMKEMLFKILPIAIEYEIKGLKKLCEEEMLLQLSSENAIKYLTEADKYKCSNVQKILSYVVEFANDFLHVPEFKSLAASHPNFMYEITKGLILKGKSV